MNKLLPFAPKLFSYEYFTINCFLMCLVKEEEALIAAHRKEIEDTMEIVREVSYNRLHKHSTIILVMQHIYRGA